MHFQMHHEIDLPGPHETFRHMVLKNFIFRETNILDKSN